LYSAESLEFKGGNGEGQTGLRPDVDFVGKWFLQTSVQIHRRSWYLMQR
jgi:hypothetical protein